MKQHNSEGYFCILLVQNIFTDKIFYLPFLEVSTFLNNKNLTDQFTLLNTNTHNGIHFVSTIEHKKYPIYATQWHPEKAQFEWVQTNHSGNINHDWNAIQTGQYFGNFLVNEARKNEQQFGNKTEEDETLIYNYSKYLKYTGFKGKGSMEEIYVLPLIFH